LHTIDEPLSPFRINEIPLPYILKPGETLQILITFAPTQPGVINTSVGFLFDGSNEAKLIYLSGNGVETVSTGTTFTLQDIEGNNIPIINFGKVFLYDTKDIRLKIVNNSDTNEITINSIQLSNQTEFNIVGLTVPLTLKPKEAREFKVSLIPSRIGNITGTLSIKDTAGSEVIVDLTAEITDFKIKTDTGTVIDYVKLSQTPYPISKPSNFVPFGAYSFIIDTGDNTNPKTVEVAITLVSIPSNLAVYKVKSDGSWVKIPDIKVSGSSVIYSIQDNGALDTNNEIGKIEDPIVVGSETDSGMENTNESNPVPEISGGGGGCSLSKNSSPDYTLLIILLILITLRIFNMRKGVMISLLSVSALMFNSCGTGVSSDSGGSVLVDTLSVEPTYISADVVDAYDDNGDNICERYVIPADDITVSVTFKSYPVQDSILPSDVTIYKYTVEYYPVDSSSPPLSAATYLITCTIKPETETTCNFTVASHKLKSYIVNNRLYGANYNLKITAYGNEVLYDNDLKFEIAGGYIIFDQFISDNDADCTPTKP